MNSLIHSGYNPYYWESEGKAEVDFIIQDKTGHIVPIEVKSSENVKAKSLKVLFYLAVSIVYIKVSF